MLFEYIIDDLLEGHSYDLSSITSLAKEEIVRCYCRAADDFVAGASSYPEAKAAFKESIDVLLPEIANRISVIDKQKQSSFEIYDHLSETLIKKSLFSSLKEQKGLFLFGVEQATKYSPYLYFDKNESFIKDDGTPILYIDCFDIDKLINNILNKKMEAPLISPSLFYSKSTTPITEENIYFYNYPYYILPLLMRDIGPYISKGDSLDKISFLIASIFTPIISNNDIFYQNDKGDYKNPISIYAAETSLYGVDKLKFTQEQVDIQDLYDQFFMIAHGLSRQESEVLKAVITKSINLSGVIDLLNSTKFVNICTEALHSEMPEWWMEFSRDKIISALDDYYNKYIYADNIHNYKHIYQQIVSQIPESIKYSNRSFSSCKSILIESQKYYIMTLSTLLKNLAKENNLKTPIIRCGHFDNTSVENAKCFSHCGLNTMHIIRKV